MSYSRCWFFFPSNLFFDLIDHVMNDNRLQNDYLQWDNRIFYSELMWSKFFVYLEHLAPSNLTAYVVNAHTLSVTWDLPSNVNDIDKVYITIIEFSQTNRTIQMQSFDNTIKKLDISINNNDPSSIHSNTTVYFFAQSSNRHGRNSSIIDYQLYINMLSKFVKQQTFFL